jgi:hypothetical protein
MHNYLYLQNMDDDDTGTTDDRGGRTDIGRDEDTPEIGDLGGQTGEVPTGSNNPGRDMYEGGMDDDTSPMDIEDEDFGLGS